MNYLKQLIQLIAIAIFAVQMVFALQKYMENPLMSSPDTKTLSNHGKPLQISVCKTGQFNYSAAKDLGYNYAINFFTGEIFSNESISWTGLHDKFTYNETFSILYNSSLENIESFLYSNGSITNRFLVSKGVCKIFYGHPTELLAIQIKGTGETYSVTISDPGSGVNFMASAHNMLGDEIRIETQPQTLKKFTYYLVQLKETHIVPSKGLCAVYPTSEYDRYADCVDEELERKIMPVLGCMVPQLSTKNQCTTPIPRLPQHASFLEWLESMFVLESTGRQFNLDSCPLPCSTVSVRVRIQAEE